MSSFRCKLYCTRNGTSKLLALFLFPSIAFGLLVELSDLFIILLIVWVVAGIAFNSHREKYCKRYCSEIHYVDEFESDSPGYFLRQMERDKRANDIGVSNIAYEIASLINHKDQSKKRDLMIDVEHLLDKKYPSLSSEKKNKIISEIENIIDQE